MHWAVPPYPCDAFEDWVHARVRGRDCVGDRIMGGGALRRREPHSGRRVLERMPGGVRVHMRGGQGRMRDAGSEE